MNLDIHESSMRGRCLTGGLFREGTEEDGKWPDMVLIVTFWQITCKEITTKLAQKS